MDKVEQILREFDRGKKPTYNEWFEKEFEVDYEPNLFEED